MSPVNTDKKIMEKFLQNFQKIQLSENFPAGTAQQLLISWEK